MVRPRQVRSRQNRALRQKTKTRLRKKKRQFDINFKVPRHRKNAFDKEQWKLDYEFKLRMESLSRKVGECHEEDPNSGVVFLKNFPHAFAELPMRRFFTQFGRIKRLRISRNRKTGKSKGYAYIEFEYAEVAKIVAETMNNYLMFRQIMKCEVVPKEKLHPKIFKGCFQKSFKPVSRELNIKKTNKCVKAAPVKVCKKLKRKATKEHKKQKMLAEMGIDYEITGHYRDEYTEIKSKLENMQQVTRLDKESARATLLENMEESTEENDGSEEEDMEDDDSEGESLNSDDESEMKTGEEIKDEITSSVKGMKRKTETDRDEAINKARKVQKEMQDKADSESKETDLNEALDEDQKVQKQVKNKAESESEEDEESSSDNESDISSEEEELVTEESTTMKPLPKSNTPEEANKKRLVTPGSKKQRLAQQESDSGGKKVVSKSPLNVEKMTPFKGSKSLVKATPKSVGKKPVPRKSSERNKITPPKGERPLMAQTSKSTGKKSSVRSKLETDSVTPTKEVSSPEQQISQLADKKSESKNSFEKEVVTPPTKPLVKQTSKSTGKKGMAKRAKMETTTPGKGQRIAPQKRSKSTGKKDLSKRRALKSS